MWFIGVEVEQETSAPPPKKNPGSVREDYSISFNLSQVGNFIGVEFLRSVSMYRKKNPPQNVKCHVVVVQ